MTDTIWVDLNKGVVTNLGTGQRGRRTEETRICHLNKLFSWIQERKGKWTVNYTGTQSLMILLLFRCLKNIRCFILNHDRYFVYHHWEFTITYPCLNIAMSWRYLVTGKWIKETDERTNTKSKSSCAIQNYAPPLQFLR